MSRATLVEQSVTPATPAAGRESIYPKTDGIWYRLDSFGVEKPLGSGAIKSGSVEIDFGATPGNKIASATITGQSSLLSTSVVQVFMMAEASTDHNDLEHVVVAEAARATAGNLVVGVGFDITCISELTLTGKFKFRYTYI